MALNSKHSKYISSAKRLVVDDLTSDFRSTVNSTGNPCLISLSACYKSSFMIV
jgi:hypothetical protein